jgi:hypothetical protein
MGADPMQLPPTSFFDRADHFIGTDEEAEEIVDSESILDLALAIRIDWPKESPNVGLRLAATMPCSTPAEAFAEARKIVDNKVEGPRK